MSNYTNIIHKGLDYNTKAKSNVKLDALHQVEDFIEEGLEGLKKEVKHLIEDRM